MTFMWNNHVLAITESIITVNITGHDYEVLYQSGKPQSTDLEVLCLSFSG